MEVNIKTKTSYISKFRLQQTTHPWRKKSFLWLSLKRKWDGTVIFLNDGLESSIETTTLVCTFKHCHKLISLSCVQFSTTYFTPFSVHPKQLFNNNCKSPQQSLRSHGLICHQLLKMTNSTSSAWELQSPLQVASLLNITLNSKD